MNTFITLACLVAVLGVSQSNPVGYGHGGGYGIIAPAAISSANLYKAAPISIIRTAAMAPIIAPAITTVPVLKTVGIGYGGLGYGGLGGGYGLGGHGLGGYGLGGYSNGIALGGYGQGYLGYGLGGKHIG